MAKRIFVVSVMVLALSVMASAAPIACDTVTSLSQLIAAGTDGCTHLDKQFNNFSYTGDSVSSINAFHEFTNGGGTQDIHGWLFSLSGGWTTGFTLSYDVTVINAPGEAIFAIKDQIDSGLTPNGTSLTDTETVLAGGGGPYSITVSGSGVETKQQLLSPVVTKLHTVSVFTPGGGHLASYEQQYFETPIPEPATFLLMGFGLLGVAVFGRRRAKQQ
jgi:hypothetical protein